MKKINEEVDGFGIPKEIDEAAFVRSKAFQALDALQMNIAIHLMLLFSLPDSNEARGWLKELNAWRKELVRKSRGKEGRKNFKHSDLVNGIWEEPLGEPHDRIARVHEILDDKKITFPSVDGKLESFKAFVMKYIDSVYNDTIFNG